VSVDLLHCNLAANSGAMQVEMDRELFCKCTGVGGLNDTLRLAHRFQRPLQRNPERKSVQGGGTLDLIAFQLLRPPDLVIVKIRKNGSPGSAAVELQPERKKGEVCCLELL